jgi:hypothetical protein
MQSACSGGTGTFVEKTARKLQISPEELAKIPYDGQSLHKVSSKCGIFAEADSNSLLKGGVPVTEIIASLFEAVVYQNLASLTKGNTPQPKVLLLGGPNLFFEGLRQAWRRHLGNLWAERQVVLPDGASPEDLIIVPDEALYYAALGCVEIGKGEAQGVGAYTGVEPTELVDRGRPARSQGQGGRQGAGAQPSTTSTAFAANMKSGDDTAAPVVDAKAADAAGRRSGAGVRRLRLRQHDRQESWCCRRKGDAVYRLCAIEGQSHRGCQVGVPADA